ncbi:MAG: hypothetical protein QOE54_7380 [Streptosporangiaceae bacterium]|nr:hypothetical protein [Streptosporangiaceae bacterium]MDX6435014.1 hypothetical protein [Streptosporangiaceae bacterium]
MSAQRDRWLRAGLTTLALAQAFVGLWAQVLPRSFYDDFPGAGRHWVSMLGAYNEHLTRDVGGLNLAFAVVFAIAAYALDRRLAAAALLGYLFYAVPHLLFHAGHLRHFPTVDVVGGMLSLGLLVVLPIVLLPMTGHLTRGGAGGASR